MNKIFNGVKNLKWNIFFNRNSSISYCHSRVVCNKVVHEMCGERITMYGWLHNSRFKGKILLLRDFSGIMQLIPTHERVLKSIPNLESVIRICGILQRRPSDQINPKMPTGEFEVFVDEIEVLNEAMHEMPMLTKESNMSNELYRMKYRFLDLRRLDCQEVFRFRSTLETEAAHFLVSHHGFVNVTTPSLFCATPGGAHEFMVPTRYAGQCYSLTQSPQQHKQLLMVAGFDRYMQIARCYRDETARPDRQPEFSQLDLELSFVTRRHVQRLVEDVLRHSLAAGVAATAKLHQLQHMEHRHINVSSLSFPVLAHKTALRLYGTDKPDLRYRLFIHRLDSGIGAKVAYCLPLTRHQFRGLSSHVCQAIETRRDGDAHVVVLKPQSTDGLTLVPPDTTDLCHLPVTWNCSQEVFPDDVASNVIFCVQGAPDNDSALKLLGVTRVMIAGDLHAQGKLNYSQNLAFAWIDQFPLFEYDSQGHFTSSHHPFTAPITDHEELLFSDPLKVMGEQFDLVCNGSEVGGGSIRIHNSDMQRHVLQNILQEDIRPFEHLLTALKCGAPPHGGFALGLDRLVAVVTGSSSIRDVMAFPKCSDGRDAMTGAPQTASEEMQQRYQLRFTASQHSDKGDLDPVKLCDEDLGSAH